MKVDRQKMIRLEAGTAPADLYIVAAAATALECSVAYLIASILPPYPAGDAADHKLRNDAEDQEVRMRAEVMERELQELAPQLVALLDRVNVMTGGPGYEIRRRAPLSTLTLLTSTDPPPPEKGHIKQ
jgi:hypothetical protein